MKNTIPTCLDYSNFLNQAVLKLKISKSEARRKYGRYTYEQWQKLLNR